MIPTILLTAFEPFAGADLNPSARVAEVIAGGVLEGAHVVTAVLPVVADEVPRRLVDLLDRHRPRAVLSLGEARDSRHIRVEQRAVNRLAFRTDNGGAETDVPVVYGAPAEYDSTFPAGSIRAAIGEAGIAATLSRSAGTYCCNQILYLALHHAATQERQMTVGFLHLPSLPEQRVSGTAVAWGMSLERVVNFR